MYDTGKVALGLVIFIGIVTFPVWQSISNHDTAAPVLEVPAGNKTCIIGNANVSADHVSFLEKWETSAVRDGITTYTAPDNQVYDISLSTCFSCHSKTKFCDSCHNYTAVQPTCWTCHSAPVEASK